MIMCAHLGPERYRLDSGTLGIWVPNHFDNSCVAVLFLDAYIQFRKSQAAFQSSSV
jgi:hypothetical protein